MSYVEQWLLRILWSMAMSAFVLGVTLPIMTIEKFLLLENSFSIISAVWQLWSEGRYGLFLLISLFSLLLPLLKLLAICQVLVQPLTHNLKHSRVLHWMHVLGRWSMLDVFVVAVMVVSVKLSAVAAVEVHGGLYAFAFSILLTMVLTGRLISLSARSVGRES